MKFVGNIVFFRPIGDSVVFVHRRDKKQLKNWCDSLSFVGKSFFVESLNVGTS